MTPSPAKKSNSANIVRNLWEQFVQATSSSYEKTRWMDLFLSEILTRLREKKTISEILTCCTPGLAGTLLSCELLSDVHQLCQQPGQHDDDTRPLRNFLLSGRGARCLLTLHALGTQGISCGRELASLLISLYPLCLQSPDAEEISGNNEFFTPESNLDIESVFKLNVHTRAKGWSLGSLHPRLSNGSVTSSTRYHRKRSSAGSAALASATSESDEELADVEGDLSPLAPTLRIQLNPMDFDYFTSVIRSEDEGEKKRSDHAKKPEDFMHDNLIPAMNLKLSVLELCQLLVSLIKKLCLSEPTDSTCQTSVQAINFSLENLCALQFGTTNLGSELQVAELKYSLVHLLLTSLERTLQHSDAINTVMQSGMFPMLLRVIEDAVRKSMQPQDNISEQEATQRKEFIYATLYGALTLLQSLLQKHEKFKDFMELFRLLSDSQGGHLIENSISILLSSPSNSASTTKAKKVVAQVGSILVSLKRVRADVVHAKQCKRHRHKQCGIPANERFHHLEIIGRTQGSVGSTCSVATLFSVLVRIAQGCGNAEVENRAVRVITQSGACCCIPPRSLLLPVLEMVRRPDFSVRAAAFTLLEKVLFAELGGSGETPASPSACAVCGTQVLSLLISSDSTSEETMGSNIIQGNNWDCLELYKTLLESQDYQLCVSIVEHIFKIIPFTSSTVKHSLLFKVFYPAFLNQKIQFFDDKSDEIPKYLLQCCLSILSSQLCNITFAEEFISRGGLDHILELISMPEFSKLCCSILEVTVVIELWRNNRDEDVATPSLLMLLKALETSAASLTSSLQRIVTKQQHRCQQGDDPMHATESDSGCLTEPTDSSDSCEPANKNTLLEQLSSFVVFWRACASLVACSPPFRAHLSSHELVTQTLKLLHLVTKQAVRGPSPGEEDYGRGTEAFLILRLLEALLIICLGVESPSESQLGNSVHECGEVLTGVRQAVMAMKPHGRSHVQALSEVLLRCAATHYFEHQVLPTRSKPELPTPPATLGVVVAHMEGEEGEGGSSLDDSYLTADEGYEADVEVPEGLPEVESPIESLLVGEDAAMSPLLAHQAQCRGGISAVSKPELCCLVVNLLVQLHEERGAEPSNLSCSLAHALQRLAALCRDSPHNCVTLAKHGVIGTLLSGFADCLQVRDSQHADLQRVILDLVSLLARYSITPHEMTLYLNFFKAEDPPCEALLWPLVTLASHSRPQPNFILCFPAEGSETNCDNVPQGTGEAETLALNLHKKHQNAGTASPWAFSAVALPLNSSLGWAPWTSGFSLALWLRLEEGKESLSASHISPRHSTVSCSSESSASIWSILGASNASSHASLSESMKSAHQCNERLLHLFSLGGEALTLEAWADINTELLVLRLSRHSERACTNNTYNEVLAETCTESGFLTRSHWHHLALNVKDYMEHKHTVLEVTVILDGWRETTLKLTFNGLLIRKTRPTCLLLGHTTASKSCAGGSWYLGSIMLFRSRVFTRERAMRLAALGPGNTGLTECEGTPPYHPNLVGLLSPRTVSCGLNWDDVLDETGGGGLKQLQDNLLLTYSAQNCNLVQIYPLVVTSPGGGMGSLFPPGQSGFRVVTTEQRASQQVPLSLHPVCLLGKGKVLEAQYFRGLAAAASLLGGVQVFLLLFARVVELKASDTEQAAALSLLLRLAHADAELFSQLVDCHKLLLRVLESPRCIASPVMLKAVLDACCDRSVMPQNGGELTVSNAVEAIVTNSFLLNMAVRAWKAWDSTALNLLFRALHALLRDDHPHREFNASQLNRAHLTETLLLFCKEKFLYEEKEENGPQLQAAVSCSLVELIRSLMGAPPEFSHVVFVADFLLLLHRASATYVTHSRNNFYFLLIPEDQGKSIYHSDHESKRAKIKLAQPIDPLKLNKALTNLHIKQNVGENELEVRGDLESIDSNRVEEEQVSSAEQQEGLSQDYSNDSGLSFLPNMENKEQQWEKFVAEAGFENGEWQQGEKANAQSLVVEGLLLLLRDTILVLPDSMSHQVLTHVVRAEVLLTMANHPDSRVRTAVVKVLSAYLQRATDEEANKFLKMKGFHLLANQLSQFEATVELVEACVALITRCQVSLEEQPELWSLREMGALQVASFPPLLALLPRCATDTALCHNTIYFLREVILKAPQSYRPLIDCGLLESLNRTLLAVLHVPPDPSDLCGVSEQDLTVGDLLVFFVMIVGHAISLPGTQNMQVVTEVLLQLSFLERRERQRCGWPSRCAQVFRDAQCSVLEGALDRLQEKGMPLSSSSRPSATILASMLSSSSDEAMSSVPPSAQVMALQGGILREVSRAEVNERCKLLLQKAVEFLLSLEPVNGQYNKTDVESSFSRAIFLLLIRSLATTLEKQPKPTVRTPWQGAIWAARDTVRVLAGQLMGWLLSPRQNLRLRLFVVHTFNAEPRCRELLSSMLQSNTQLEHRFHMFFRDLAFDPTGEVTLTGSDARVFASLFSNLQTWGILPPTPRVVPPDPACWAEELALLHEVIDRQRNATAGPIEAAQLRSLQRHELLAKTVAEAAMLTTRAAVEAQNGERKAFIEHIKAAHSETVQLRAKWHRIVQQLTHERAPWFFSESYPRSWQLDPTEGPGRVRNRLKRCHLGIKEKYLMPEYQHKLEAYEHPSPFSYLFAEDSSRCGSSSVLIERLHTNEKVRHMVAAQVVIPEHEISGELLVGETCLYFVPEELEAVSCGPCSTLEQQHHGSVAWQFEEIREIHPRRFQLQERAVEVFLTNGKTYFLAFPTLEDRNVFLQVLIQHCHLPNLQPADTLSDVLQLWREGIISNFEYLSQLNKMAGRSFNDLMQYPVFPFVLADYTSPRLDLASPAVYRNFERPMAVQDKKNEQHYVDTYNYLKQELQMGHTTIYLNQEPHHYGSHYSNSGTVLHFLVRMPPFTRMFLRYQDNNFDIPDRTFHSLYTTWRLTSSDSTTDVKELIPEFFFLPEFLLNTEGFSLGVRQSGERVHHVMLPSWCGGDPRHFMLVHRQALESDYVRENLPHWIDLVFGFKQTGKPAVDAINVFHPATYYGFDSSTIKDPLERKAWETMVRTYGQTPRQLFRTPHPMVVQALASKDSKASSAVPLPLGGAVQNLRWGSYVGSPTEGEPHIAWKHVHRTPVAGLVPLRNNDVFGLAPCTSLLLVYNGKGGFLGSPSVQGAALVSWSHADGVVRAKLRKDQPLRPLVQCPCLDPVLLCASTPDVPQLWLALASGRLLVLRFPLHATKGVLEPCEAPCQLLGHEERVLTLSICRAFSIAVSGSQDGTAIIWDINTLSYVRTIPSVGAPVQLVTVSDVSGDIATTCPANLEQGSCLRLYTVNASLIGKVMCEEQITTLCFSCAPEGSSINVIAAGLSSGDVRMWNTWDLAPVRKITCDLLNCAIISLVYSHDAQHLYASAADGTVVIWETAGARGKTAKFLNLTSL